VVIVVFPAARQLVLDDGPPLGGAIGPFGLGDRSQIRPGALDLMTILRKGAAAADGKRSAYCSGDSSDGLLWRRLGADWGAGKRLGIGPMRHRQDAPRWELARKIGAHLCDLEAGEAGFGAEGGKLQEANSPTVTFTRDGCEFRKSGVGAFMRGAGAGSGMGFGLAFRWRGVWEKFPAKAGGWLEMRDDVENWGEH